MLTYDFRLPPGPRTVEYALLAEDLGFRAVWCPEIPAFGHDIWVTLARIAEKTKRLKFGPSVLIPSYRHPMAQASAIATLEQIAPGRLMVGFGTGFTGRAGMGKKPLSLASMRTHIAQVKTLLRGDIADIDGGLAQILASDGWLPDRPINVPVYMAGQGPKARALAKEITDGLISLGGPAEGFETCLVSTGGTVLDDGEDVTSPRSKALTCVMCARMLSNDSCFLPIPARPVKPVPNPTIRRPGAICSIVAMPEAWAIGWR